MHADIERLEKREEAKKQSETKQKKRNLCGYTEEEAASAKAWLEKNCPRLTQTTLAQKTIAQQGTTTKQTTTTTQQKTTTTTQQKTTTTTQQETATSVMVRGLHANVYQVELGHDVAATPTVSTKKLHIDTIKKGTRLWVFEAVTQFQHCFKFIHKNGGVYQALQSEFDDGTIRASQPKPKQ
jgi:hypothetical protein